MADLRQLKLGVVGWNGRGGKVAMEFQEFTNGLMVPVACVDPLEHNYKQGCEAFGCTPNHYATVEDMVANEELDCAIIGSPNEFHLEGLKGFAEKPVPILLEKPLDSTWDKICDVVRFSLTYPKPIVVGHCMRYAPVLKKAREIIDSGAIGRISSVRFVQNCHYGNGGYHNWRRNREKSGTWLIEKATHDFDIMLWFLQKKPSSVAAMQRLHAFGGDKPNDLHCHACDERFTCPESMQNITRRRGLSNPDEVRPAHDLCVYAKEVDTPDNDHCLIAFEDGVVGTYQQWFFSPTSYHHRIYEVWGSEGAMEVDLGSTEGGKILVTKRFGSQDDTETHFFDYLGRNHYNGDSIMPDHCYQVFTGQAEPHTTVAQAFLAEALGYAAIKSADEGKMVDPMTLVPDDLKPVLAGQVY
jgi:predicted dehydrogenase